MADITDALLLRLGVRLEEPILDGTEWDPTVKLAKLNMAQIQFINLIDPVYLTELEVIDLSVDISAGYKDIETLTGGSSGGSGCTACNQYANGSIVLHGAKGIVNVYVKPGGVAADGQWATLINFNNIKRYRGHRTPSNTNMFYYVFRKRLTVLLTTYTATVADIYWRKIPCEITLDADPEINSSFHEILLDLAEAACWDSKGEYPDRYKTAIDSAMAQIKLLNDQAKVKE
jgi:hypothetical protein